VAITPYLYYEDVERAMGFLEKAFGFRPYGDPMRAPDGRINHAAMKRGDALVMMGRPGKGYRNPKRLGRTTQCLYVEIRGVDEHFQRAREAGAGILAKPADTEYGHRRYGVTDLEGHEWYFAQAIRRSTAKRKAAKKRGSFSRQTPMTTRTRTSHDAT
jgi:uncharacterized glyoxalase superfamily protein PhnB